MSDADKTFSDTTIQICKMIDQFNDFERALSKYLASIGVSVEYGVTPLSERDTGLDSDEAAFVECFKNRLKLITAAFDRLLENQP